MKLSGSTSKITWMQPVSPTKFNSPASHSVNRPMPRRLRQVSALAVLLLCLQILMALGILEGSATAQAQSDGYSLGHGVKIPLYASGITKTRFNAAPQISARSASAAPKRSAIANVNYDAGFKANSAARDAFQYAVDIWSSLVASSVPIEINASFFNLPPPQVGSAGPNNFQFNFPNAPQQNVLYPIALANALAGKDLDPPSTNSTGFDIDAIFSSTPYDPNSPNGSGPNWYFRKPGDSTTPTPADKVDFTSVVLHELCHGLGFVASTKVSPSLPATPTQGGWGSQPPFVQPFVFDTFIFNATGQKLIDTSLFPNPSAALLSQFTGGGNGLYLKGANINTVPGIGAQGAKLYTPAPYSSASISHLDEIYNPSATQTSAPDALMTYLFDSGETELNPGPIVLALFQDMGWKLTSAAPAITSLSPTAATVGSANLTLTVNGTNFVAGSSTVLWNGVSRQTNFLSATQLTALIPASDLAVAGNANVAVTNGSGVPAASVAFSIIAPVPPGAFYTITPARLYDSERGSTEPTGGEGAITTGAVRTVKAINFVGIPTTATAILANITVKGAVGGGFVSLFRNDVSDVGTASVNWYGAGARVVGTFAIIGLDQTGSFKIKGGGTTDLVIDVTGYVAPNIISGGGVFKSLNSGVNARLYDSRPGASSILGDNNGPLLRGTGALSPVRTLPVASASSPQGIPTTATAVIVNVTVTNTGGGGFVTLYPATAANAPAVASVNWVNKASNSNVQSTVGNFSIVPLGNGQINAVVGGNNPSAGADIIIDVIGYIDGVAGSTTNFYNPLASPGRLYDSRLGTSLYPGSSIQGVLAAKATRTISARGVLGIPNTAKAVLLNITTVDGSNGGGGLALFPGSASAWPGNSSVNTTSANQVINNLAIVTLDASGNFTVYNFHPTNSWGFVLDVVGYIS